MRTLEIPRRHTTNAHRLAGRSSRPRFARPSRAHLISEAIVANYIHAISAQGPEHAPVRDPRSFESAPPHNGATEGG
jgi:hypothetical protein